MTDIGRSSQTNSTEHENAVYSTSGPAFISSSRKEEEAREEEPNIDRKQVRWASLPDFGMATLTDPNT